MTRRCSKSSVLPNRIRPVPSGLERHRAPEQHIENAEGGRRQGPEGVSFGVEGFLVR